ncbi:MAG: TrkH family potassium uptake protein [Candidatus Neomarinimicrobiota bacterium]
MANKNKNTDIFVFLILIFGLLSLLLRYGLPASAQVKTLLNITNFFVIAFYIGGLILRFYLTHFRLIFFRNTLFDIFLLLFLVAIFIYSDIKPFLLDIHRASAFATNLIFLRTLLSLIKILGRIKKLNYFIKSVYRHPAQTIAISFLIVIVLGTIFLMMSFSSATDRSVPFIDALFTATSAVCVTGLITVNTATQYSIWGKIIIMLLIQIGGLGIMILSYFGAFVVGKRISLEEKFALSFLLNEQDLQKISSSIVKIIGFTLIIELTGAALLFSDFRSIFGVGPKALFYSLFHAVSAFCNAGFSLFSDNFESYRSNVSLNLTIAFLIITGGLSFAVLSDLLDNFWMNIKSKLFSQHIRRKRLSVNSKAVIAVTAILLVSGTLIIYAFEHRNLLLSFDLKTQYLSAFFQSVTLRTAGFNTIAIGNLQTYTLLIMTLFMFIGGASGSTAGGVKVNTISVIFAYIKSVVRGKEEVTLMKHALSKELVNKSFLIIILALSTVFTVTTMLLITENFRLEQVLFEVVSAFGTVGLSTGITPMLSFFGKFIIAVTMFIGRIGPMTLVIAFSQKSEMYKIRLPEGNILIG